MSSPVRILIVDDEFAIRTSLSAFFEDYDFDVVTAESAEEALECIERESFHVVVVDLRLPGISGESLILKAYETRPEMLFLIHTGSVDYKLSDELKKIGLSEKHLFLKPLPDLTSIVESVLAMLGEKDG